MKRKIISLVVGFIAAAAAIYAFVVSRPAEISHVVLISLDTTRADHFSCYGFPERTTPHIDEVAENAVRFEHVVSPVPITLPAHSSMLTGTIPPFHGVHHNIGYKLGAENITLAEILKGQGFQTAAIIGAIVLDRKMGLDQGFDLYNDQFGELHRNRFGRERKADEGTRAAIDWLEKSSEEKSFLFLHYYDPHVEYAPPEPFASAFSDNPYAGEIAYTDDCIGQVIGKLKELGIYDSTLLIITADHGEMLGEHGEDEHTYFIYEAAIRVPMIIKVPGQDNPLTIAEPVGLVDIVPTVCSLLDIELPGPVQGMDLSGFLRGEVPGQYERHIYAESTGPARIGVSSLMSISTGRWKYIQAPRAELYDVYADPGEARNLLADEKQRARILEDKLKQILEHSVRRDQDSSIELDAESIRKLESLGYVAGKTEGEMVFDTDKDDPKDYIHVYNDFHRALHLRDEGKYLEAEALLYKLVEDRPDFGELYIKLGDIAMMFQNYNDAILHYRKADELGLPLYSHVYNNLAWLQATRPSLKSRNVDEAIIYAERICQAVNYSDPSMLDTLAVAYAAAGQYRRAANTARQAHAIALSRKDMVKAQKIADRVKLFESQQPYLED